MSKLTKHTAPIQRIHRSLIKNAPYNPRVINPKAKKKLQSKIKEHGIVMTLTWNSRSGNLVGGHQRINILDQLEGSQDYELDVSVVDLDDKQEKELNVFLNNREAQGEYDEAGLTKLLAEGISGTEMGFDAETVEMIFEDSTPLGQMIEDQSKKSEQDGEAIEKLKVKRDKWQDKKRHMQDSEFFTVVVFQNRDQVTQFHEGLRIDPEDRYIDGLRLARMLDKFDFPFLAEENGDAKKAESPKPRAGKK